MEIVRKLGLGFSDSYNFTMEMKLEELREKEKDLVFGSQKKI